MTVWNLYTGDPITGDGTDTVSAISVGDFSRCRSDTSKADGVAWQFEVHVITGNYYLAIGIYDATGPLLEYQAGDGLIYNSGGGSVGGVTYTSGDIITVTHDGVSADVYFYKNGVLVDYDYPIGYTGLPVHTYVRLRSTAGSPPSVQGVWDTLTYDKGQPDWNASDPPLVGLRTFPLPSTQEGERTIWVPIALRGERTFPLATGQEGSRTLLWYDADVGRRSIVMPAQQVGVRSLDLQSTTPQLGARTLDLTSVATELSEGLRTFRAPLAQVGRRTLDAGMTTVVEGVRTFPVGVSVLLEGVRTLVATTSSTERTEGVRNLVIATQSRAGVSVTGALRLLVRGRPVEILQGEIWADEGSPYWQSQITLARTEDYARLPVGQAYTLEIYGTEYAQIVDTRQLSRGFSGDQPGDAATIGGLSPAALLASPRALGVNRTWDMPVLASAVADELLGSVDWQAVDWLIPAYRLASQGQTPLEIVATLAAAVGATLESGADGSLRVRPLYPVRAPDMARASPALTLGDDDIYTVSESPETTTVVTRVRVTDGTAEADGYQDRLEFEADETDPQAGTVRAYPLPWRPGTTVRSTRSRVVLYPTGGQSREITETVEIRDGVASTQYPPLTLLTAEYLDTDLGALTVAGSEIRTAVQGWGLLTISYMVRSIEYRAVSLDPDLSALVVMEDGD